MISDDVLVVTRQGQLAELWQNSSWRVTVYFAACVVLGALGGLLWSATTPLPTYRIRDDLTASITERGQAAVAAGDVHFALITGVVGLLCGVVGWLILQRMGWFVVIAPLLAATAASLMAWQLGLTVGQTGFAARLAAANPGDVVQIDLQLRSWSALLVGPFGAITPVMLLAAFWPEPRVDQLAEESLGSD